MLAIANRLLLHWPRRTVEFKSTPIGVGCHGADVPKNTVFALKIRRQFKKPAVSTFGEEPVESEVRAFHSTPKKILLPIDFSSSSKAALEMAADLAKHFHAELHLVNVIPMFPTTTMPDLVPEGEFIREARTFAELHLAKCHAVLAARGVKSTSSVEVENDITGNIMEVVEREHTDMLVISTHGISGWHPLVFGSIAEKIVKLVQCPLLLPRSTRHKDDVNTPSGRSAKWW